METQGLTIPRDILVDILLKLPYKSLMRFKLTCKSWHDLILSHEFKKAHHNLSLWRYGVITTHDRGHPHPSINLYTVDAEASKRNLVRFDYPLKYSSGADILGSCNGMLLITLDMMTELFLWNPFTGIYKEFSCNSYFRGQDYILWGLGYDSFSDDYKVVYIARTLSPPASPSSFSGDFIYDATVVSVCSVKTGSWITIDPRDWYSYGYEVISSAPGIVVNGSPHWVMNRFRPRKKFRVDRVIIYFDVKEEKFKEVPLPEWLGKNFKYELGVLGDLLCIVHNNNAENYFEIWTMKEYGVKESWIQFLVIPQPFESVKPLRFTKNGEIIMEINRNKLVIYNIEGNTYKTVLLCENRCGFNATAYVESFVSPNIENRTKFQDHKYEKRKRSKFSYL